MSGQNKLLNYFVAAAHHLLNLVNQNKHQARKQTVILQVMAI